MNGDPGYALQKLELAILLLAIGAGDVRSRLLVAYRRELHVIQDEDFPQCLQSEWLWIKSRLNKNGPRLGQDGTVYCDAVDNTLHRMPKATGSEIASRLVNLRDALRGYLNDLRQVPLTPVPGALSR